MDILSAEELNRLRNAGESKLVEYKKADDLNDHDEILRQLSAFANRVGGTILYGVRDDLLAFAADDKRRTVLTQTRQFPFLDRDSGHRDLYASDVCGRFYAGLDVEAVQS